MPDSYIKSYFLVNYVAQQNIKISPYSNRNPLFMISRIHLQRLEYNQHHEREGNYGTVSKKSMIWQNLCPHITSTGDLNRRSTIGHVSSIPTMQFVIEIFRNTQSKSYHWARLDVDGAGPSAANSQTEMLCGNTGCLLWFNEPRNSYITNGHSCQQKKYIVWKVT